MERENQVGDSAAKLTEFMTDVGMMVAQQDQIIQGFILREMSGNRSFETDGDNTGPYAPEYGKTALPQRILST